jgi:hypothetical protein
MKYFIFYNTEVREVRAKKEADYDEDENQLEEEETRELNHFWAGSNILISYTMPLIYSANNLLTKYSIVTPFL